MEAYRQTAKARAESEQQKIELHYQQAWATARSAANFLKREYGVGKVVVLGSLVNKSLFHWRSDIDLAVYQFPRADYFRAVAQLQTLDPDFSIDLIEIEYASPALQQKITSEGKIL